MTPPSESPKAGDRVRYSHTWEFRILGRNNVFAWGPDDSGRTHEALLSELHLVASESAKTAPLSEETVQKIRDSVTVSGIVIPRNANVSVVDIRDLCDSWLSQRDALEAAQRLLLDVGMSGVEFSDPRVRYLTVQIDEKTWRAIQDQLPVQEQRAVSPPHPVSQKDT